MILNNNTGPQFESGTKQKILNDLHHLKIFAYKMLWFGINLTKWGTEKSAEGRKIILGSLSIKYLDFYNQNLLHIPDSLHCTSRKT